MGLLLFLAKLSLPFLSMMNEKRKKKKKLLSPSVFVQRGSALRFFFNYGMVYIVTGWESGILCA
jgi:hypothetical protein